MNNSLLTIVRLCDGGLPGAPWDIEHNEARVRATRLHSNYLLIPAQKEEIVILFRFVPADQIRFGIMKYGTIAEAVTCNLKLPKYPLMSGDTLHIDLRSMPREDFFFWFSLNFIRLELNITTTIEVLY